MSYMPLGISYLFGRFFYAMIYYIFPYRKKVVRQNIQNAFPKRTVAEQKKISKNFYRYFTKLLAEAIKNLTISEKQLKKRMRVKNPEIMDELYKDGKDVLLLSSHFYNWEMLITAQGLLFKHKAIGIGTPLSDKFWDKKINDRRERFGMTVVHANNYKEVLASYKNEPTATLILGDQSPPGKVENCYWTTFLNQPTAFFFGAEILANQTNSAVVYATINCVKTGYYEIELKELTTQPRTLVYGQITRAYIQTLEADILETPHAWLWSHKRWKKETPEQIEAIKKQHQKRFEEKYRAKEVLT